MIKKVKVWGNVFNPGIINVIVGRNGSGKTRLLEEIALRNTEAFVKCLNSVCESIRGLEGKRELSEFFQECLSGKQVILLDDFGGNMHPNLSQQVVKVMIDIAAKANVQFFIATHNKDIVDIFFNDVFLSFLPEAKIEFLRKNLRIIRIYNVDGETVIECLKYDACKKEIELGLDLRGV